MSIPVNFENINKPKEIEGFWDLYLIRPLGEFLVSFLKETKITPMMVSGFSVAAGLLAAYFYFQTGTHHNNWAWAFLGFLSYLLCSVFDSADGQLARVTGKASHFGRLVDGLCDNFVAVALYLAILLSFYARVGEVLWFYFFLAAAAGYSHSLQCALTDFYRQIYLFFVYDKKEVVEEEPDQLEGIIEIKNAFWKKIFHGLYIDYAHKQRFFASSTYRLLQNVRKNPNYTKKRLEVAQVYKVHQKKMLKFWAFLGPNSHKIVLVLTAFLPLTGSSLISQWGMVWFFLYEFLFLNFLTVILTLWQRRLDNKIIAEMGQVLKL